VVVHRRVAALLVAVLALGGAAACGAPDYEYVKSSAHKTYFKIPANWHRIDQTRLDGWITGDPDSATAKLRQKMLWTVAYDGNPDATVAHIFGFGVTPLPVVWAKVEQLPPGLRGGVSLDTLRDMVLPVTETARAEPGAAVLELTDFELLVDDVVAPEPGLHGVHLVYNYRLGAVLHTFDQTALVNDDVSLVYLFFVRCTAACYTDRAEELRTVVSSFTVRRS
jgi:hypothetical protein